MSTGRNYRFKTDIRALDGVERKLKQSCTCDFRILCVTILPRKPEDALLDRKSEDAKSSSWKQQDANAWARKLKKQILSPRAIVIDVYLQVTAHHTVCIVHCRRPKAVGNFPPLLFFAWLSKWHSWELPILRWLRVTEKPSHSFPFFHRKLHHR